MSFRDQIESIFREGVVLLAAGNALECRRHLDQIYTFDEALARFPISGADQFATALMEISQTRTAEAAVTALEDPSVLRIQCQIDLLKAIVALLLSETEFFVNAIGDLLDRACFIDFGDLELVHRIISSAVAWHSNNPLTRNRLVMVATRLFASRGQWEAALFWINQLEAPLEPFSQSAEQLKAEIEEHLR